MPPSIRLIFLGGTGLFLELILIRFLPGNIWNLGYFPNLVLLAVFLGMGVGFIFHSRFNERLSLQLYSCLPLLLLSFIALIYAYPPLMPGFNPHAGEIGGEIYFTDSSHLHSPIHLFSFAGWFLVLVFIFGVISQFTAKIFLKLDAISAYQWDILGSLVAIVIFAGMSIWQLNAVAWFILFAVGYFFSNGHSPLKKCLATLPLVVLAGLIYVHDYGLNTHQITAWSPYQKVSLTKGNWGRWVLSVNGIAHQEFVNEREIEGTFYLSPYLYRKKIQNLPPYRNVLVIGSGGGNDIMAALLNRSQHIDALEIDPVIAKFGQKYHPSQPYRDSRVTLIIDDARSWLTRTHKKYDLILFALTDSLVRASALSQLRLENYLYTQESIKKAFDLLEPNGNLMLYNFYRQPWLQDRIQQLLRHTTQRDPAVIWQSGDLKVFSVGTESPAASSIENLVPLPTDNWPFLYLQKRGFPTIYLAALFVLISMVSSLMIYLSKQVRVDSGYQVKTRLIFVLMGMAFLLLQTKSVIQFSLLFGTTWQNNALVFLGCLTSVLGANFLVKKVPFQQRRGGISLLLLLCTLLECFFDLSSLLNLESVTVRALVAVLFTFSPIFFANLLFSLSFKKVVAPSDAYGWNLLGAALGGIFEYTSMAYGYHFLSLVVFLLYLAVIVLLNLETVPKLFSLPRVERVTVS